MPGTATKCETVTMNSEPLLIAFFGVMISSWPSRFNDAGAPLTATEPTLSPEKSRSKRESDWVARARMFTVPSTGSLNLFP